jgi:hypothetical protein
MGQAVTSHLPKIQTLEMKDRGLIATSHFPRIQDPLRRNIVMIVLSSSESKKSCS